MQDDTYKGGHHFILKISRKLNVGFQAARVIENSSTNYLSIGIMDLISRDCEIWVWRYHARNCLERTRTSTLLAEPKRLLYLVASSILGVLRSLLCIGAE